MREPSRLETKRPPRPRLVRSHENACSMMSYVQGGASLQPVLSRVASATPSLPTLSCPKTHGVKDASTCRPQDEACAREVDLADALALENDERTAVGAERNIGQARDG